MPKPASIPLTPALDVPILYEDRSVLAIDKPAGWLLVPSDWNRTARNLQLAIICSIKAGDFWARSRNLKFLRFIHRLDAETTGVLLFARSAGGVPVYSRLFESRGVLKTYYAVAEGVPPANEWVCRARIGLDTYRPGRMKIDPRQGKESETSFTVVDRSGTSSLIRAVPVTGRTHQIRLHLLDARLKILGDAAYGGGTKGPHREYPLALRAAGLEYADPFSRRRVVVNAPMNSFFKAFGFKGSVQN
jgi:23S rRNA pseudouridine1911/1915/1917 synthase